MVCLLYGSVSISEGGSFLRRFFVVVLALLVVCSFLFLGQPAHAQGRVSVQCGHSYVGQQLDFTDVHRGGHGEVDVQITGNNAASITCPSVSKVGGYTGRVSCNNGQIFELFTNSNAYDDCFGGSGYLSVYITQIDSEWWYYSHHTTIAYQSQFYPHWFYCYDYNTMGRGTNDGLINVINIDDSQGGFCPDPLL